MWGPERITLHNDAFLPLLGRNPLAQGQPFDEVWQEAWPAIGPFAERAYAGEATFIEDFSLVVHRSGFSEQTYFTFCYSPIRDDNGHVAGFLDTVIETTAKVRAEQRAKLINAELAHRIQNMLTIRWQIESRIGEDYFRLTWIESNGPVVIAPERRGFGSLLIEHVLADDFHGKVDVNYHPQGLRCELTTRLSNLLA